MNYSVLIERVWRRLLTVVSLGRVTVVDDSGPIQLAQIDFGPNQVVDGVRMSYYFGFSSNPPPQTDVVAVTMTGDRSKAAQGSSNNQQYRYKNLESGGSVLYDMNGNFVRLTSSGIAINSNNLPIFVSAGSGNITVSANDVMLDADNVSTSSVFQAGNGWTGTFRTGDNRTVTVQSGIITGVA